MARVHLMDKIAREAPLAATADWHIPFYDDEVSGFGLRVTKNGARAWVYRYRHNGRTRIYTIGSPPSWKATTARREAARLTRLVDQGHDPQGEKDAARQAPTVADLCERYLAEHAVRKRSGAQDERMIERIVRPALGSRKVADIKFADIDHLHRKVSTTGSSGKRAKGSPYAANRIVSLLSKMLSLAVKWEMRTDNPAKGVERNIEPPLERHLQADELERLLATLAGWPDQQIVDIVFLLMETGCRPGELFKATWDQFDEPGLWVKPSSHTKQQKKHREPLSGAAQLRLNRMRESSTSEFLFPGRGVEHITTIRGPWKKICEAAHIKGRFRLYDLRHSTASFLAADGGDLLTIGAMLGHTQPATTRRYVHLFDDKLRAAADGMGARLAGKPKAEVRNLRARR